MGRGEAMSARPRIWGLGVGPGDPELITLKALKLLQMADVVAYPAPEQGESFARRIVAEHLPGGQREIAIRMPLGDGAFPKAEIYDRAARQLLEEAEQGRRVVVLCEGDPFFYGSFIYLSARLADRAELTIVPGVSSLMACAAAAGGALARGNESLAVLPGPLPESELRSRLSGVETAAIIKVGRHLPKIRRVLEELGLEQRACYIEHATLDSQRVMPLARAAEVGAPYFSMILIRSAA
jgi:precorrin-2/cobalt-factor-2 C20-methyltransferase